MGKEGDDGGSCSIEDGSIIEYNLCSNKHTSDFVYVVANFIIVD